ncbi:hypothetical protein TrLO_g13128 [Triparma laevis f. longispina]|uniref:EGF-like domain-containing protein n=1 Tax=Triparma laevis f. longispina TaxID=1714387 RepID=A0A9W7FF92_9STRA|nr:hypothetical protein TrLO_g13128 [Triparma laevis f. longispina]
MVFISLFCLCCVFFLALHHSFTLFASGRGKVIGRKWADAKNAKEVLALVQAEGWASSVVHAKADQKHVNAPCFYQGNCSLHGENLLGRCFCFPGWTGEQCEVDERQSTPVCTNRGDTCFYTDEAGVFAISLERWHVAQEAELVTWDNWDPVASGGDRINDHLLGFDLYREVGEIGANLGNFLEVGCGPWTQSVTMMKTRAFDVEKYVLLEPGALNYAANTKDTVYASGQIDGFDGKTVVVNAGGEHLDLFLEVFDTIMMVNVLEHTNNAISILRGLYNALKPGGLLIMNERWLDTFDPPEELDLNALYHPIRMKQTVFDHFISVGFDIIRDCRTAECHNADIVKNYGTSTYFIGRKKESCA